MVGLSSDAIHLVGDLHRQISRSGRVDGCGRPPDGACIKKVVEKYFILLLLYIHRSIYFLVKRCIFYLKGQ